MRDPRFAPRSSGVPAGGATHLGGVSTLGDVIDLSWQPGGSWILEEQAAV